MKPVGTWLAEEPVVGPVQRGLATILCAVLLLSAAFLTPHADRPLPPLPGYMTAFCAAMLVTNLLLALLLYSRGHTEEDPATVQLGSAYFFVAAIFLPLAAVFPDAIVNGSLLGTPASAVWVWSFWHAGFGLAILRYALRVRQPRGGPTRLGREVLAVLVLVALATALSTVWMELLPPVFVNGRTFFSGPVEALPWVLLLIDVIALLAVARLKDPTPEQLWLTVGMAAACFDVWLTFLGSDRFSLGWYVAKQGSLFTTMAVLLSFLHALAVLYRRVSTANLLLARLVNQDGLTGLANRRRFDEALENEWRRARRERRPLSLLMLDVDLFKRYNDRYGHLGGDECLKTVAEVIAHCVHRPADVAARYGGEEFAVILPGTPLAGAFELAHRIRERLAAQALPHADAPLGRVTVSIGVASLVPTGQDAEQLVRLADAALYRAKAEGRDRVCGSDRASPAAQSA
ncbi:diguanylate cyclase [Caldimonas tepidiphila]|uniref:GGDEF domain-containing protein n=1 Tax=Caldimonas tepidiphila TaxID=2315841 RepID=UPI0014733723|nr:GGDEF domain-containing protein [Caldimonas tepidiphila]